MIVTINRKKWLRGGRGTSYLRHPESKRQCCLGFLAIKCGYSQDQITGVGSPSGLCDITLKNKFPKSFVNEAANNRVLNKAVTTELMEVNDKPKITAKERERQIRALFKRAGIQVRFIN